MQKYLVYLLFSLTLLSSFELQKPMQYRDQNISGWCMSEKLDGIRGYWDGRHLFTKRGYRINTPDYFIQNFPSFPLDGELWIGRGKYEEVQSIVLDTTPSSKWKNVTYNIFEVPNAEGNFSQRIAKARKWFHLHANKFVHIIEQKKCYSHKKLQIFLEEVIAKGGEGVIVKNPKLPYFRGRSRNILKVKRFSDAEAVVVAINPGKGKYKNMMGSLTVRMFDGTRFRIGTGFSDQERKNPPAVGSIVTFKYCGWTQKHKPKFASFLRKRNIKTVVVK